MVKKSLVSALVVFFIFSCSSNSQGQRTSDIPNLVGRFLAMHALYHDFTPEISERMLLNYINSFDPGRYYFYQSDIDEFMKHKTKLGDYISQGNYDIMFRIFKVFQERFRERQTYLKAALKDEYDFSRDEYIIADRSTVNFAVDTRDMNERWRKNIKLQLLNYITAGKKIDQARDKLWKKYQITEKNLGEIKEEKLVTQYINAFSMALDPHSNYLSIDEHEDFKIHMELKLEGIGARLSSEDGFVKIESLIPGGPADKMPKSAKPRPNDKIVAVSQGNSEAIDVINMELRDVVKKIRGPKGTEVRLTIIRENDDTGKSERLIIPIIREEVKLKDSDADSKTRKIQVNGAEINVGYLKLPSFYQDSASGKSSAEDTRQHLKKLMAEKVAVVVLDLRGNPGGLLNEAVEIAGLFIEHGPIVQVKDGHNRPHVMSDNDDGALYRGPLVVLIDKFSASASEILAGAIRDYNRGVIIGSSPTFGKGTVQSYNVLPRRLGAVKITTHIFYQPSGNSNQLNGVEPHIVVPELSALWDISEAKTRYPLQWKPIPSAQYQPLTMVNDAMIGTLRANSLKRVNSDEKFAELQKKIQKFRAQINKKTISLKEESVLTKQKEDEMKKTRDAADEDKILDLERDIFLKEALTVAGEYTLLLKR